MVEETESKRETSFLLRTIEELHAGEDGLENLGKLVGSVISAPRVNFSLSLFLMYSRYFHRRYYLLLFGKYPTWSGMRESECFVEYPTGREKGVRGGYWEWTGSSSIH